METSRVVIHLEDGRVLDSGLEETEEPWGTEAELTATIEKKFRWLTSYVLEEDRAEALLDMLWRFDQVQDVRELTELLKTR